MAIRALVLDANILIRAVLGNRVRQIPEEYADCVPFYIPEPAFQDAAEHLPLLADKRGGNPEEALRTLDTIAAVGEIVGEDVYADFEADARSRLGSRDPEEWPILACALALDCPIWTEDTDFFGCGVATWRSNSVKIFLSAKHGRSD